MNIRLVKTIDSYLGSLLVHCVAKPVQTAGTQRINSCLLIRPGGIGDAVHLLPAILLLKTQIPQIAIDVLAEKRNASVFSFCQDVRRVYCYDRGGELLKVLCSRYDVVIDTEQWHRLSAVVTRCINSFMKVGFATNKRSRMFTHQVPYSQEEYESESFLALLEALGIRPHSSPSRVIELPVAASIGAGRLLAPLGEEPFVAVFPGASIQERRWGQERFHQLVRGLLSLNIKSVVVGGKEDREAGEAIIAGGAGLNLAGMASLEETAAIIDRSTLLLSGDSGVLHIAVALGKPTVSLFGPGRAKKWAPRGDEHIVISKNMECSPCTTFGTTPPCSQHARCLREIGVDEVLNAITMLLTNRGVLTSGCCKRDYLEIKV